MYFGNVLTDPEVKFVMMKSSKLSANESSAAARMPGSSSVHVGGPVVPDEARIRRGAIGGCDRSGPSPRRARGQGQGTGAESDATEDRLAREDRLALTIVRAGDGDSVAEDGIPRKGTGHGGNS